MPYSSRKSKLRPNDPIVDDRGVCVTGLSSSGPVTHELRSVSGCVPASTPHPTPWGSRATGAGTDRSVTDPCCAGTPNLAVSVWEVRHGNAPDVAGTADVGGISSAVRERRILHHYHKGTA